MLNERSPHVYELIGRIEDVAYSNDFMFGQQNAGHIGISITEHDGTQSDVKNLVGKHPAVVGIDTLSFYGYEGNFEQLVKVVKELHREGCLITLSSHMPNFSLGGDDFFDYSPNFTDGNIGVRILPGGDLNEKYLRFLDKIVEFASLCVDVDGEPIQEDYINELTNTKLDFIGPQTVPEGCVFVMGDNRNASVDSRKKEIGMLDNRLILGRAYYVIFPLSVLRAIK